ncbi:MAG: NADP-dependent oxidoreductase [Acidimicrobiales bacterium]
MTDTSLPTTTRLVTLRARPSAGGPVADDFAVEERPIPDLAPGQLLLRNIVMSVDPSMRGRLETTEKQYTYNFEIGEPLDGSAIGVVLASTAPDVAVGTVVRHRMGWRDHAVIDASTATAVDTDAAPAGSWLGVLGQTGFTAWVGLKRIAEMREGDVVFVSAAAGAVGTAAAQFAKLLGASRVVGSAGGAAKVQRLIDDLGYDDGFDYRGERAKAALRRVAPDGIDVYFDNVGGEQLVAALDNMRINGRIALCGMISQFDTSARVYDINRLIESVLRRVTIRGFIVRDHEDMRPEFEQRVSAWLRSGEVVNHQTVADGIDHAVDAFLGMLKGDNIGKALVRLDTTWPV